MHTEVGDLRRIYLSEALFERIKIDRINSKNKTFIKPFIAYQIKIISLRKWNKKYNKQFNKIIWKTYLLNFRYNKNIFVKFKAFFYIICPYLKKYIHKFEERTIL